jgi:TolA-binding protein
MNKCILDSKDKESLVDAFLNDELSQAQREMLDNHLAVCDECAHLMHTISTFSSAWKENSSVKIPDQLRERIGDRVFDVIENTNAKELRIARQKKKGKSLFVAAGFAIAAAIAAVLLFPYVVGKERPDASQEEPGPAIEPLSRVESVNPKEKIAQREERPRTQTLIESVEGGIVVLERAGEKAQPVSEGQYLDLNSTMMVGSDATVRLAISDFATIVLSDSAVVEMIDDSEDVGLKMKRGTAAIWVVHDRLAGSFKVIAPAGEVEVTGTVFLVHVSSASQLKVAVVEGALTVRDSADNRNVIRLGPSEETEVDWSDLRIRPIDTDLDSIIRRQLGLVDSEAQDFSEKKVVFLKDRNGRSDFEALFAKATEARKAGKLSEASHIYEQIARGSDDINLGSEAAFTLGQLYFSAGDMAGAERTLTKYSSLIEKSNYRAMALFYLAKSRCRLGKKQEAMAAIDEFLETSPQHPMASAVRELRSQCAQ